MSSKFLILAINLWHYLLSFVARSIFAVETGCRFYPSCSEYTKWAIVKFGAVKGLKLGIFRILRCQPLTQARIDKVL